MKIYILLRKKNINIILLTLLLIGCSIGYLFSFIIKDEFNCESNTIEVNDIPCLPDKYSVKLDTNLVFDNNQTNSLDSKHFKNNFQPDDYTSKYTHLFNNKNLNSNNESLTSDVEDLGLDKLFQEEKHNSSKELPFPSNTETPIPSNTELPNNSLFISDSLKTLQEQLKANEINLKNLEQLKVDNLTKRSANENLREERAYLLKEINQFQKDSLPESSKAKTNLHSNESTDVDEVAEYFRKISEYHPKPYPEFEEKFKTLAEKAALPEKDAEVAKTLSLLSREAARHNPHKGAYFEDLATKTSNTVNNNEDSYHLDKLFDESNHDNNNE